MDSMDVMDAMDWVKPPEGGTTNMDRLGACATGVTTGRGACATKPVSCAIEMDVINGY